MSDLVGKKAWLMQCSFLNMKGKPCVASAVIFADSEELAQESFKKDVQISCPKSFTLAISKPHLIIGVTVSEEALNPDNACISVVCF